ncbi:MAG: FecR domain-containing protein [Myxococcaceae bacterium]
MSEARPSFAGQLREAEVSLSDETLRDERSRQIWRQLQLKRAGAASKRPVKLLALGLATALLVFGVIAWRVFWPGASEVAGMTVANRSVGFEPVLADGVMSVTSGEATLLEKSLRLQVHVGKGARLKREAGGLRVVSGEASFVADKRLPTETPARVLVSGGAIEVIGTRFTVKQEGDSGELVLYEGVVRFVVSDGRIVTVLPGEAFRWPVPPEPPLNVPRPPEPPMVEPQADLETDAGVSPSPLPPSDSQTVVPKSADDWSVHDRLLRARVVLEEVPRLREAGKSRQALFRIRNALAHDLPSTTREQLVTWEAEILEDDLDQPTEACRTWREYMWLFPGGRFEERAKSELKSGCR